MSELINNAFTGVNIIPTILLILVLIYWLTVILGIIDIDFFDFDIDFDIADGTDGLDGLQGILAYFNLKEIPLMIILSILSLVFWILSMLLYLLPIKAGGLINGLLLILTLIISAFITKLISLPLKGLFKNMYYKGKEDEEKVIGHLVSLCCNLEKGRLGQAEVKQDGASILINVKCEFTEDKFEKNEEAFVTKKDDEKNIYYIAKVYINK